MLKPTDDPTHARWVADLFSTVSGDGFVVPRPIAVAAGGWVAAGWAGWEHLPGEVAASSRLPEVVTVADAFHAALRNVTRPPFVGTGDDPWSVGDRVAWGEQASPATGPVQDLVDELLAVLAPIDLPEQLVHGDIGGNVMFRDDAPPVVIDLAPYWRPPDWSIAVAAVDLLAWSEVPPTILAALAGRRHMDQLVARALAYRLVTEAIVRSDAASAATVVAANRPVVDLLVRRIRDGVAYTSYVDEAALTTAIVAATGAEVHLGGPLDGGHSGALVRGAVVGGRAAVLKSGRTRADRAVAAEVPVYRALGRQPFLAELLGAGEEPVPFVVLEHVDGRPPSLSAELLSKVAALLDDLSACAPPPGLRLLLDPAVGGTKPWDAVADAPTRLARLDVDRAWMDRALPALREAAAEPTSPATVWCTST